MRMALLTAAILIAAPAAAAPVTYVSKVDPMTDKASAFALATDGTNRLAIGCFQAGDAPMVIINTKRWIKPGVDYTGLRSIQSRFDHDAPQAPEWRVVDSTTAQLEKRGDVQAFVRRAMTADRVLIRTPGLSLPDIDLSFDLAGARPAIERALAACAAR